MTPASARRGFTVESGTPSVPYDGGVAEGKQSGLILGIESSCDETAAAVVRGGREVLANVVASQMKLHADYGGVVPELASREHLKNIVPVVRAAMRESGAALGEDGGPLRFRDLDAIAVTEGPGLAGALLVGITYAKALALGSGRLLIAVNHLEGHIHAVLMEQGSGNRTGNREQGTGGPLLALVVSGGHTHLYLAEGCAWDGGKTNTEILSGAQNDASGKVWRYRNVGRTVDDAAGEAFDKVAKLLGLGYPGGPWMDALAKRGDPLAVEFRFQEIKRRQPTTPGLDPATGPGQAGGRAEGGGEQTGEKQVPPLRYGMTTEENGEAPSFDFSFSGIKTAVLRYIQAHGMERAIEARRDALRGALEENPALGPAEAAELLPWLFDRQTLDLIASFQHAVVGNLVRQTLRAAEAWGATGVVVSGGVSANSELRRRFVEEAARRGTGVEFPARAMSTDNAAMIAAAAWGKLRAGEIAGDGLAAAPGLRLGGAE